MKDPSLEHDPLAGTVDGAAGALLTNATLDHVDDVADPDERGHIRFAEEEGHCQEHSIALRKVSRE
jgi:hypothetical protein